MHRQTPRSPKPNTENAFNNFKLTPKCSRKNMPANIAKKKKVIAYDDNFERKMSPSAIT